MMAAKTPRRMTEVEKMRLRAGRLQDLAIGLPKATMKVAAKTAALLECDEVKRASGARAHGPDYNPTGLHGILANSGDASRTDEPKPVHVPAPPKRRKRPNAPDDFLNALGGPIEGTDDALSQPDDDSEAEDFIWPELPEDDDDDGSDNEENDE
jgi:hypothetical protein